MLTICNAIPISFKHFNLIDTAIESILNQSLKPNEIILIISEFKDEIKTQQKIEDIKIKVEKNQINFKFQTNSQIQYAGKNREIAYHLSESQLIIYQDADDIPHNQRNEILLKYHLETKAIHLIHGWNNQTNQELNLKNIVKINSINDYQKLVNNKKFIHNGAITLAKYLITKINFPNDKKGQDTKFNREFIKNNKNSLFLETNEIYTYNNHLSSWKIK
jgi:glycosyltransferase involved in cell wall biosynthesis